MDPAVDKTHGGLQGATPWMGRRILVLARATARARWILPVTRYVSNWLIGDVSNRRAQGCVYSVAVSHDGRWVVSGSGDRGVQFWDTKSGIVQLMLRGHQRAGSLSPRSIQASWTDGSSVLVYSTDLSPTGSLLATGSFDCQVRICKSRYPPEFSLALTCWFFVCFREIHYRFLTAVYFAHKLSSPFSFSFVSLV